MTQAPTPGPLDSESVKLLVKGDLLRIDTGGALYEFVRRKSPPSALIVAKPALGGAERYYDRCRFSFVERPSLAPTAPVEDVSTKSPETNTSADHVKETAENQHVAAPVEASGSEREAWACVDFNPDLSMSGEGYCLRCGRHQDEHARPQPSGETREALNVALAEHDHWIKEALKHKRPKGLRSDCENRDLERARIAKRIADKIAALIRPAPVASGCQHSSGEGVDLTFGMGTLVVNTGTFGGDNAVFIAKATAPGEIGAYTGNAAFKRDVLQPGEHVLIFPTAQQAQVVADTLVGAVPAQHDDKLDAERFRALMRCGRIKMQGSSGVDPHTLERNGNNVHFGAEFWPEPYDPAKWEETYGASTRWGRACLRHLADAVIETEAALQQEG